MKHVAHLENIDPNKEYPELSVKACNWMAVIWFILMLAVVVYFFVEGGYNLTLVE